MNLEFCRRKLPNELRSFNHKLKIYMYKMLILNLLLSSVVVRVTDCDSFMQYD